MANKPVLHWTQMPMTTDRWISICGDYDCEVIRLDQTKYVARYNHVVLRQFYPTLEEAQLAIENLLRRRISVILQILTPSEDVVHDDQGRHESGPEEQAVDDTSGER